LKKKQIQSENEIEGVNSGQPKSKTKPANSNVIPNTIVNESDKE